MDIKYKFTRKAVPMQRIINQSMETAGCLQIFF